MVGHVEKTRILFDRSGRSTGSAFVKFARRSDAEASIEKYNNVELDGKNISLCLFFDYVIFKMYARCKRVY